MAADAPTQLLPEDKLPFGAPFSYAKAIIKDDVTYPIVSNCPIINVDNPLEFNANNIPVGTFFIVHFQQSSSSWAESLCLRVPNDTKIADENFRLNDGLIIIGSRSSSVSSGGGDVNETSAQ